MSDRAAYRVRLLASAAICGAIGGTSAYGFTCSRGAVTVLAARSNSTSMYWPLSHPATTGFIPMAVLPRAPKACSKAQLTKVLPTPVPVPVMK